jgi:hypothetical protein
MKHLKPYELFESSGHRISEAVIAPSSEEGTMSLWHGGNLEDAYDDTISHKKGRWEYGPGLYLTTQYDTASKFAKGSRKFYMITVKKGTDLKDVQLPMTVIQEFVNEYVIKNKRKDFMQATDRHVKDGKMNAEVFLNIIINHQSINSKDTNQLRNFFVRNGIDYSTVDNAYGWGERMIVLFNMKNMIGKVQVKPGDKIETYDLPKKFNET